jgi:hypothetical protein
LNQRLINIRRVLNFNLFLWLGGWHGLIEAHKLVESILDGIL